MAANHDPGEGPSTTTPRYQLGRGRGGRLSLVSDIENVEGDQYHDANEGSPTSGLSGDSSLQLVYGYSASGSPTRTHYPAAYDLGAPQLANFPTSGGLPVPSTTLYGPSVPSIYVPSVSPEPSIHSAYGPPVPQSYGTPGPGPYERGLRPGDEQRLSMLSEPSATDLGLRESPGKEAEHASTLSENNPQPYDSTGELAERSNSIRTQSSIGALGSRDPYGSPPPAAPPQMPTKKTKLILDVIPSRPIQFSGQMAQPVGSPSEHPRVVRQLSSDTASGFAMASPTSPTNRHVRFNPDSKTAFPIESQDAQLPIPPHVLEMLRSSQPMSRTPHYYHGPPPLHGAEAPPPQYSHSRSASSPTMTTTAPSLTPTLTPDGKPRTWSEKVGFFDPTDKDPSKPWWKRRKGYCFWIILGLAGLAIVISTIVGIVLGKQLNKHHSNGHMWAPRNSSDLPPPVGFVGTWSFTTQLTNVSSACSPTLDGADTDLWRCFPYENPPSQTEAVWSFFISKANRTINSTESETGNALLIASAGNPFALQFPAQPLYLMQFPENGTMFYQFSYNYTETTTVTYNGQIADCEFPSSVLTATLFVNTTEFKWLKTNSSGNVNRGEWPGPVTISETKIGGGRQVVCRDKQTLDVLELGPITPRHGDGNCLCQYDNYDL
ncbi:hypothetical protein TWF694_009695 [Orbilia ellipsospora]|uniref:Uncharacterized protein n=1 Tax=Orbilia ellipsospora TaxID=2528407 RepID=A0AAV9XCW4_9PEZI